MSNTNRKRPNDIHPVELRYRRAKSALMHRIYKLPYKDRKEHEIDAAWMFKQVEDYGFRGCPSLYAVPVIMKIEAKLRDENEKV